MVDIVFVGHYQEALKERMRVKGIIIKYSYGSSEEFLAALRKGEVREIDKVVLIPNAFSPELDNFTTITEIQEEMKYKVNGATLMIFCWGKDVYATILRDSLITYRSTILVPASDQLKGSHVIHLLLNAQVEDIPGAVYTDAVVAVPVVQTAVEEVAVSEEKVKEEVPAFLKTSFTPPAVKKVEYETQEDFERHITRFLPPVGEYTETDGKVIVVCSLTPGAGSSFIANNMATVLARETQPSAVVEYLGNAPSLNNYLNGDSSESGKPEHWNSIASRVHNDSTVNGRDYWKAHNVFWFPLTEEDYGKDFTTDNIKDYMRATNVAKYRFLDISTNWTDEKLSEVFDDCHEIWVVVRPNISTIQRKLNEFRTVMMKWAKKTVFVGNGFDSYTSGDGVIDQIDNLIKTNPEYLYNPENPNAKRKQEIYAWKDKELSLALPMQNSSSVSKAEWGGKPLAKLADGGAQLRNDLGNLVEGLAPELQETMTNVATKKKAGLPKFGLFRK